MGELESNTLRFDVNGTIFQVSIPNLRVSMFAETVLGRAAIAARDNTSDNPISIDGDAALFPFMLEIHRTRGYCRIPSDVSREAVLQQARLFGLSISIENIVHEGSGDDGVLDGAAQYYKTWTVDQVVDWLKTLQQGRFAMYCDGFRSLALDGSRLADLTDGTLKDVGVNDPRTRLALLAAISSEANAGTSATLKKSAETPRDQVEVAQSPEQDEEGVEDVSAAALILRTMLGPNGSASPFIEMIADWRSKNLSIESDAALDTRVRGPSPEELAKRAVNGILVAARVRPLLSNGSDRAALDMGDFDSITSVASKDGIVVHLCGMQRDGQTPKVDEKLFRIHMPLGPAVDENCLFDVATPLVDTAVRDRVHTTVICYGQTGSGKTHTVGHLAWRIARHLYDTHDAKCVVLEAFELRGGSKGLVSSTSNVFSLHTDSKPELSILEGKDGTVHVGGSNSVTDGESQTLNLAHCNLASSREELEILFREAESRRASSDTQRNSVSSRTHAFYRFYIAEVTRQDLLEPPVVLGTGACIELVDLAGSESNKDSMYHNKTLIDERAKINKSLSALNTCIQKSVQGASFVPFRSDKLTQLLRPCFLKRDGDQSKQPSVLFLACLSPLASDAQQSIRTLTYTQELAGVKAKPVRTAQSKKLMAPCLKRLADAAETRDIHELRAAMTMAQNNGVTGPERKRALAVLQELEAALQAEELE
eukprot:TRINITY_DN72171_c0_g1_i1.p1 TRINITY_DN72171_c0_g1~~TRINITY_DN72171_c0_g1_i1.p1  ORF type:complete len:709 (+),score=71.29 TRINITY_DN72171_c0_g1_i1:80-2206(+)